MNDKFNKCVQEKHLRDKFRMQNSGGAVTTGDQSTTGAHAGHIGSESTSKQAGILSSATAGQIRSEEIQSLDRSPQHSAVVRGRRESSNTAKTTSPGRVHVTVDNNQRSTEARSGSQEKKVHSETTTYSPAATTSDSCTAAVAHTSVISREGQPQRARLIHSGTRRPSGHVSDSASKCERTNDHRSRRSMSSSGARRSGCVSDTSFSAVVDNAASESARNTIVEGV